MSKQQNSFDVVSKIDVQEVSNAVQQATKEIQQRFDFKGSKSSIQFDGKEVVLFDIIFGAALVMILISTVQLDHASLFGLKQAWAAAQKQPLPDEEFKTTGLFSRIRHPITSGLIVALWSHETLTADRLLMNLLFTAYALTGTIFEEKSLIESFGDKYREYRQRVPAFIPRLR